MTEGGWTMDDIDDLLGLDENQDVDRLAGELVRADFAWVDQLVALRKRLGLTQAQVATAMGRSQSVVSDIETMSSDPRLSTLRRYALAIGAAVKHRVLPAVATRPPVASVTTGMTVTVDDSGVLGFSAGFYVSSSPGTHLVQIGGPA